MTGRATVPSLWVEESASSVDATADRLEPIPPSKPAGRSPKLLVLVIGLVVALVASVAIAGAYVWFGWGTTEPEAVLPGSSVAFIRADLAPGLGQKLAIQELTKKFPQSQGNGGDIVAQAKHGLANTIFSNLDYDADIAPWLGSRIGIAVWTPGGDKSKPCLVAALASNDDAKAAAALKKETPATYAFAKGYAVVSVCGQSGGGADAAVAAARSEALSDHAAFAEALRSLPTGQSIVGWVDLGLVTTTLRNVLSKSFGGPGITVPTATPTAAANLILGVKATADSAELRLRIHLGSGPAAVSADALTQLAALPANSTIGLAADLRSLKRLADSLPTDFPTGFPGGLPSGFPTDLPTVLPTDFPSDFPTNFPSDFPTNFPSDFPTNFPSDFPTGLLLPGGAGDPTGGIALLSGVLRDVFGSVITLAISDASAPDAKLVIQAADPDAAREIAGSFTGHGSEPGPNVTVSGSTVNVTSAGYRAGSGRLGDDPNYKRAMADGPESAYIAGYVNVSKLLPALDRTDATELKPVKAVGVSFGIAGGDVVGLIRIIVA